MTNGTLLWADDEIELLRPCIIFLKNKGYEVLTATNGQDALDLCREQPVDIIFLDENMPGLSGLETLQLIKEMNPSLPVVMITKSEEENIMDMALGAKIADYLIKPVHPSQILLTLKKHLHKRALETEATNSNYQQNFSRLGMQINECETIEDWQEVYRRLVFWELELADADSPMTETLQMQKAEANAAFARFVGHNYQSWIDAQPGQRPTMSPDVFRKSVFPALDRNEQVYLVVFDNLRYDQWCVISKQLASDFHIDDELYLSILPTATQYSRNAIFAGLMPSQIAAMFPKLWVDEDEEEGKNLNESPLVQTHLDRCRRADVSYSYNKLNHGADTERLVAQFAQLSQKQLNVIVVNFIDMLSHARTESTMVRELASDERAYRSITASWFQNSPVRQLFTALAQTNATVIVTTDHGSIRVDSPTKIIGDKNTNTNLRYKLGKNLSYNQRDVFAIKEPKRVYLPAPNLSTTYVFAKNDSFFAYPNNYNYYVNYYRNTFQHGGISLEEMLIPLATLKPKKPQQ